MLQKPLQPAPRSVSHVVHLINGLMNLPDTLRLFAAATEISSPGLVNLTHGIVHPGHILSHTFA